MLSISDSTLRHGRDIGAVVIKIGVLSVKIGSIAVLLLLPPSPGGAVRPESEHRKDAKRFGLDRPAAARTSPRANRGRVQDALQRFNARPSGRHSLRFGPAGVGDPQAGAARRATRDVVMDFLREFGEGLGVSPDEVRLEISKTSRGKHHLLFRQVYQGVPVEFSSLKVHLRENGEIISLQSSIRSLLGLSPVPGISSDAAARAVQADLGIPLAQGGTLVFYPKPETGDVRLAWKFLHAGAGGNWVYYVDAFSGELLFRYNDLRFICVKTSGTVTGQVYDVDPVTPPGLVTRPMANQKVYFYNQQQREYSVTTSTGHFCSTTTASRVWTSLQGPFANVAHYNGPNAHYQNAAGVWKTAGTQISSKHPYDNDSITVSTITITSENALDVAFVLPRFSVFDVGSFDPVLGDILDNDQVSIVAADGFPVATYVGNRTAFFGAMVPGNRMNIRLSTTKAGRRNGFEINISSYLVVGPTASTPQNETATFTWTTAQTHDGTRDEINLFYQINRMHDYFRTRVSSGGVESAPLDVPIPVMARMGPNLANAFYDPVHKNLSFGDVGNGFALDATVVRHEYTHFVIDQVYPIVNFGQNGAISEGLADYFSASSLGVSSIGTFTQSSLGGTGAFRELVCTGNSGSNPCKVFPTNWTGLIHTDGLMVSQALWEIRQGLLNNPPTPGPTLDCADGLVYQALFYFPDSFQELLDALLTVSANTATDVPACGANNTLTGLITASFATHGISMTNTDDIYEPNDGIQSATSITTATTISGRIHPQGDLDYFTIGAGPGLIEVTMTLPPADESGTYLAYTMNLIDSQHEVVATASPPFDINPTLSGFCPEPPKPQGADCKTSAQTFSLSYLNAGPQQFYLAVSAPPGAEGLVSRNNSELFYQLSAEYNRAGPVDVAVVSAAFDRDVLNFSVRVSSYLVQQNYFFDHAQLRDHVFNVIPETRTDSVAPYLAFVSSANGFGFMSGQLRLRPGFDVRFPALGTVHVEVIGRNKLGNLQSFGFSQPINLGTDKASLKAFNNVFNPLQGGVTTFKYEVNSPGHVRLRLFTLNGEHLATLVDEDLPAGKGSVDWSGANGLGRIVATGIYLLNLEGPGVNETKKVVVVK